jgi:hypothetical protein
MLGRVGKQETETKLGEEEPLPVKRTTIEQRREWIAERRESLRERDAQRLAMTETLAARDGTEIPRERGFLILPPGRVPPADAVVEAANELIESVGHDELVASYTKRKPAGLAREFLPKKQARRLDSPYMRFALDEDVLALVAGYLGICPILTGFDVWYSVHTEEELHSSQMWHLDGDDTTQVKVWVHLSDIGPDSGPTTIIDAASSAVVAERVGYDYNEHYRVPDEHITEIVSRDQMVSFTGPVGTVDFVDTSRCFHFGSRVQSGAAPRRLFTAQYVTPYAFDVDDLLKDAPLRKLVSDSSSELERLVLGGL